MFKNKNTAVKKRILMFGTFDIIHAGHENLFQQARKLGDEIIVVIARDQTVKRVKGRPPMNNESKRAKQLKQSSLAEKIVLGNIVDKYEVIKKYKPDIIALGYDQYAFTFGLEKLIIDLKLNTKIIRLEPYEPKIYKTSLLQKKPADLAEISS